MATELLGNFINEDELVSCVSRFFRQVLATQTSIDKKILEPMLIVLRHMVLKDKIGPKQTTISALETINKLINQRSMEKFYDEQMFIQFLSWMDGNYFPCNFVTPVVLSLLKHLPAEPRKELIKSKLSPRLKEIVIDYVDRSFTYPLLNAMHLLDGLIYNNCDYASDLLDDPKFVEKLEEHLQKRMQYLEKTSFYFYSSLKSEISLIAQVVGVISTKCPTIENIETLSTLQSLLEKEQMQKFAVYKAELSRKNSKLFAKETSLMGKLF